MSGQGPITEVDSVSKVGLKLLSGWSQHAALTGLARIGDTMGLRDTLRGMRGGGKKAAPDEGPDVEAPEPTWFQPRYDGCYQAAGAGVILRFLPGGRAFESTDGQDPGPEQQNPCRGEYTPAGRFNVQRQFERIVSYIVREADPVEVRDGFAANRFDAADRTAADLQFVFKPDAG